MYLTLLALIGMFWTGGMVLMANATAGYLVFVLSLALFAATRLARRKQRNG
jgi:hypothetical protein